MRKALLVALPIAGVAVVAGLGIAVAGQGDGSGTASPSSSASTSGAPSGPGDGASPTSASASSSAAVPETPSTPADGTPSGTPQGAPVQVVLGYAGWEPNGTVEVGGFVSSAVETGGTCTATLTQGDREVEVAGPAEPDATVTNCGSLVVPGEQLAPGDWEAVLSYSSASSHGESQSATVTVPAR